MDSVYKTKRISFFKRQVTIFMQNKNGPCPLLAVANILSLRNLLPEVFQSATDVSQERLTAVITEQLLELNKPRGDDKTEYNLNTARNLHDSFDILGKLATGIDVNVKFHSVFGFEATREVTVFDLFGIRLVHGWLYDPDDTPTATALGSKSYNQVVEMLLDSTGTLPAGQREQQQQQQELSARATSEQASVSALAVDGKRSPSSTLLGHSSQATVVRSNNNMSNKEEVQGSDEVQPLSAENEHMGCVQSAGATSGAGGERKVRDRASEMGQKVEDLPTIPADGQHQEQAQHVAGAQANEEEAVDTICRPGNGINAPPPFKASEIKQAVGSASTLSAASAEEGAVEKSSHIAISERRQSIESRGQLDDVLARQQLTQSSLERGGTGAPIEAANGENIMGPSLAPGGTPQLVDTPAPRAPTNEPPRCTPAGMEHVQVVREFLDGNCSQLTMYGLSQLQHCLRERELAIFFRNNHFSTLFKNNSMIYLLVTDQGFIHESEIVWERLDNIDGDTQFCGPDFQPFQPHTQGREPVQDVQLPADSGIDADLALALQLQEQEDFEASEARRRQERQRQQQRQEQQHLEQQQQQQGRQQQRPQQQLPYAYQRQQQPAHATVNPSRQRASPELKCSIM